MAIIHWFRDMEHAVEDEKFLSQKKVRLGTLGSTCDGFSEECRLEAARKYITKGGL